MGFSRDKAVNAVRRCSQTCSVQKRSPDPTPNTPEKSKTARHVLDADVDGEQLPSDSCVLEYVLSTPSDDTSQAFLVPGDAPSRAAQADE